jgi:hypothetical protein
MFELLNMATDQPQAPNVAAILLLMDQLPATRCITRVRLPVEVGFLFSLPHSYRLRNPLSYPQMRSRR